mgnify:CR=1 FL=1
MKRKKNKLNFYSTNPDFNIENEDFEKITLQPKEQNLHVCIDKHRAGKIAIIIKGFEGNTSDLKKLGKKLKIKPFLNTVLKKMAIMVLINRDHNSYPIKAKYIGLSLSTTLKEYIRVDLSNKNSGVYLS